MPFMPFQVLGIWLRGLLSLALIGLGAFLLKEWYEHRTAPVEPPRAVAPEAIDGADAPARGAARGDAAPRRGLWHLGFDRDTAYLLGGLALILASIGGGSLSYPLLRKSEGVTPKSAEADGPAAGATAHRLRRPDGSELHVTTLGPEDGPAIVMTHGWGVDASEWRYSEKALAANHRVILWDLPGLGRSDRPKDNDFSLEKMARDLDAVLDLAGGRPAVVVGHSIGGMIALTYCRLFPEKLGPRVAGLVLVHTTYTNPAKTTSMSGLHTAIQKPVLEPLCHLMIGLAPVVYAMNWMSYLNGSMHRSTEKSSFSGNETREQLKLASLYGAKAWPGVLGRGMLAMFRYDATATLPAIGIPVLVVPGDEDNTTRPEASAVMAESIPGATLQALGPARHMGHMEHHQAFASAVGRFVAEIGAARPARTSSAAGP